MAGIGIGAGLGVAASGGEGFAAGFADDFGGTAGNTIATAPISAAWTLHDQYFIDNAAPALDTIETIDGRLRLYVNDNAGNSGNGKSLIWRTGGADYLGAVHYKLMTPPFSVAAIGCRISDPAAYATDLTQTGEYIFCGLQVRNPDMLAKYEHCVIGYRVGVETLEWKRRSGATAVGQGDVGAFGTGEAQGDVRVDVAAGGARTWYYRQTIGTGAWIEMTSGWGSVATPDLTNGSGQMAVGVVSYGFDDFTPPWAAYIDRTEDDPV